MSVYRLEHNPVLKIHNRQQYFIQMSLASYIVVVGSISQCLFSPMSLHLRSSAASPDLSDVFGKIYDEKLWGSGPEDGMGSGSGSSISNTDLLRRSLADFIQSKSIHEMYDIPCGTMYWTRPFLNGIWQSDKSFTYVGMDVAKGVVNDLNRSIKDPRVSVLHRNVAAQGFEKVDVRDPEHSMVMSRQMLQHLSDVDVCQALKNLFRIPAKYFLVDYFPEEVSNEDITSGEFRAINLQAPPFNLPVPEKILDDDPQYPRQMFVYKLSELRNANICDGL
mmetsp:Transcript_21675/g.38081  ORF Transcript_21675/g.38081 Transcript_21675/m.38081 type:complete len:277 (+) Transcript_21675:1-831(+)